MYALTTYFKVVEIGEVVRFVNNYDFHFYAVKYLRRSVDVRQIYSKPFLLSKSFSMLIFQLPNLTLRNVI